MMLPKSVLLEPAFIVLAFTFGTIVNRQRSLGEKNTDTAVKAADAAEKGTFSDPGEKCEQQIGQPRFLARFPFLLEIWYWNLTYWIYQSIRAWSAKAIAGNEAIFKTAEEHALSILRAEKTVGLAIEQPLQEYVLAHTPWLMSILAKVYYSHICLGVAFIVYAYKFFPPATFRRIRRTIAVDNFISLVIFSTWRCSPPRLLPESYGFVDVLHRHPKALGGSIWTHNSFQLTIVAMPTLHFGTALLFGVVVWRYSPHRWMRIIAPWWPAVMLFTILATANHFVLDAVVGSMVPAIGFHYNEAILIFEPLRQWILSTLKLEKRDCEMPEGHETWLTEKQD